MHGKYYLHHQSIMFDCYLAYIKVTISANWTINIVFGALKPQAAKCCPANCVCVFVSFIFCIHLSECCALAPTYCRQKKMCPILTNSPYARTINMMPQVWSIAHHLHKYSHHITSQHKRKALLLVGWLSCNITRKLYLRACNESI